MMSQPVYLAPAQGYPVDFNPGPQFNQPAAWSAPAQPQAAPASFASAQSSSAPRPIIRAKGADDSFAPERLANADTSVPLGIPSPQQLGISMPASAEATSVTSVNWERTHRELERLAAVSYRLDKLQEGGCRFTCLLPTSQAGLTHRVEAEAATEAEAVRLVLNKAREWSAGK